MTKAETLLSMLADWAPAKDLETQLGWKAHTLRGAISTLAKKRGIEIERSRENGVTSYRVKPQSVAA